MQRAVSGNSIDISRAHDADTEDNLCWNRPGGRILTMRFIAWDLRKFTLTSNRIATAHPFMLRGSEGTTWLLERVNVAAKSFRPAKARGAGCSGNQGHEPSRVHRAP